MIPSRSITAKLVRSTIPRTAPPRPGGNGCSAAARFPMPAPPSFGFLGEANESRYSPVMSLATVAAASGEEIVPFDVGRADQSIFRALLPARSGYGGKKAAVVDGDERVLTYDDLVRASLALGHALKKGTRPG